MRPCQEKCAATSATVALTAAGVAGDGVSRRKRSPSNSPVSVSTGAPLIPVPPMSMPRISTIVTFLPYAACPKNVSNEDTLRWCPAYLLPGLLARGEEQRLTSSAARQTLLLVAPAPADGTTYKQARCPGKGNKAMRRWDKALGGSAADCACLDQR